jgi:glucose 1-dehydrogenase
MSVQGKSALITGSSSGLGRQIALRFAKEGVRVICADIRPEPLGLAEGSPATHDLIVFRGGESGFQPTDVSNEQSVTNAVAATVKRFGSLDIVLNNAATFRPNAVVDTSLADWDVMMRVNLQGQFLIAREAIRTMLTQEPVDGVRGKIINMSSQLGLVGPPHDFAYAVTKGGTVQMTRQLAVDYGPMGINVNAIAPGKILTGTHPYHEAEGSDHMRYANARTPFHRLGRPEDLEGPALFLAGPGSNYVSGHTLAVDGGWLAA